MDKLKKLVEEADQRSKLRMEEIKNNNLQLHDFLMEIKQRFGGGKISNLKWRNKNVA